MTNNNAMELVGYCTEYFSPRCHAKASIENGKKILTVTQISPARTVVRELFEDSNGREHRGKIVKVHSYGK